MDSGRARLIPGGFIQARGGLKKERMDPLRSKRRMRRSRHASEHGQSRGRSSMPSQSGKDRSDSRPLGRRSVGRCEEQLHCQPGGASPARGNLDTADRISNVGSNCGFV